jgi:prefoldin subunit 5
MILSFISSSLVAVYTLDLTMQSFENSLKELEPSDSVKRKIQEKNQRMRIIGQQMDEIHTKQMDIKNESEQYRDTIRYECIIYIAQACLFRG